MKQTIIAFLMLIPFFGFSQTVNKASLAECFTWAKDAFPLMEQKDISAKITALRIELLDLQKKPTINWNASMTFQSENISLDLPLPGFEPVSLPLLKGQTTIEANYTIYDGGILDAQKQTYQADLKVQEQQIEVEFEKIKPQITKAFLGIGLLKQQIIILQQAIKTISTKLPPLEVAIQNGVALPSSLQRLKIEVVKLENQIHEIEGSIKVLIQVLESWTNKNFSDSVEIVLPNLNHVDFAQQGNHPEFQLFELQKQQILSKESLLTARQQPKVGAFAQAGIGYPNPLNFFDENISPFAIVGVKFQWNIFDWGKTNKERQLLSVNTQTFDIKKKVFERNLSIVDDRYKAEIAKIESFLDKDRALISMYNTLIKELEIQVDNGVTTTTDYLTQINEQTLAKLQLQTHIVQLQQVKIEYLIHKGM